MQLSKIYAKFFRNKITLISIDWKKTVCGVIYNFNVLCIQPSCFNNSHKQVFVNANHVFSTAIAIETLNLIPLLMIHSREGFTLAYFCSLVGRRPLTLSGMVLFVASHVMDFVFLITGSFHCPFCITNLQIIQNL